MSDCSLHVGKLMVPRPRCSIALTLDSIYDETEPQQGIHAPEQRLGRSSTWTRI